MEILVQKFGGTSVASYEKMQSICEIAKREKNLGKDLVLVVSAMGRKGAPYATDTLISLITQVTEKPSKRELDILMSCGEIISGTILANILIANGIDAEFLTGAQAGIITTELYSNAKIKYIDTTRIKKGLSENKVVVIAGFQGITENGEITTLGRGGSDTSAVAIGKALGCDTVEIYTDVDGIMTADPRVEPDAKIMEYINYDEVFQMADKGAKVIHPKAVQIAESANITLAIKNTMNLDCEGTKICSEEDVAESIKDSDEKFTGAVANKDNIAQVKIFSQVDLNEVLEKIENKHISIDMINFFVHEKVFVIDETDIDELKNILDDFKLNYEVISNCSKVTLISSKITSVPGIMSKIVKGLSKEGIDILQTSDSHMTISCLVDKKDMNRAVRAIHKEFQGF
ncbi:MAG: aspartate kinase [Clostridioides sp.]|jgi:aspartate kinase|nr:aspartate kinase [Clostridioides sp.]